MKSKYSFFCKGALYRGKGKFSSLLLRKKTVDHECNSFYFVATSLLPSTSILLVYINGGRLVVISIYTELAQTAELTLLLYSHILYLKTISIPTVLRT